VVVGILLPPALALKAVAAVEAAAVARLALQPPAKAVAVAAAVALALQQPVLALEAVGAAAQALPP